MRSLKIISSAKYLPKRAVTSSEIDKLLNTEDGWAMKKSGVKVRHFVDDETSPEMGAIVVKETLEKAGLKFSDIDCMVSASGTQAQEIPCTSSLIQEQLGEIDSGIPCFDINSTCLSFLTALDMMSYAVSAGRFKRVVIVSTEVASVGLNFEEKESASLMGDGAAAIIIEEDSTNSSGVLFSKMETYSSGAHDAEIRGGGSMKHPFRGKDVKDEDFYFNMNGPRVFKLASKLMIPFCDRLFEGQDITLEDIDIVIPHQASKMAMGLVQKKLKIGDDKFFKFVEDHGNQIAASIPTGIHNALTEGRIKKGDKVLLLGTSAGFSIAGLVLRF